MEVTEPTDWYAGIVIIVTKINSQVRICVDLIKFKCREQHFIPALEILVGQLKGANYFSNLRRCQLRILANRVGS